MKQMIRALAVFLLVFISMKSISQEKGITTFRLGEKDLDTLVAAGKQEVISASRSEKFVEDLPVTVQVITRQEILDNGYVTLVDVLKSIPGIKVSQPGSAADGETFLVRGLYGNYYCKILIDNIPVQPSVVSGMPIGEQLPIRQAERIEVVFGPSSAVYGADALAGVINIITHESERPVNASADVALGSNFFRYLNVSIGGKVGKNKNVMTYSLYGNYSNQNDQRIKYDVPDLYNPALYDTSYHYLQSPVYQGDSTSPVLGNLPRASDMLGFSLKWRGLSIRYLLMDRQMHSSIGMATNVYSYANPRNYWGESIQRISLSYDLGGKKLASSTTLSYLWYRLDEQSSLSLIEPVSQSGQYFQYAASDDLFLEEKLTWVPLPGLEIVGGASLQVSGNLPLTNYLSSPFDPSGYSPFSTDPITDTTIFNGFGFNPIRFTDLGVYLQLFYRVGKFNIMGGYRFDDHSIYGLSHSPRLAILFRPISPLAFRISAGTGFRGPSGYYSYSSLAYREGDSIQYRIIPNPGLKPERILAAELGARWEHQRWLVLDVALFYHHLDRQFTRSFGVVDPVKYPLAVNLLAESYVNDDQSMAELWGLQASAVFKDLVRSVSLNLEAHITLSSGKETLPLGFGELDRYRMMPRVMGQLDLSLRPVRSIYIFFRNTFTGDSYRRYIPLPVAELDQLGYDVRQKGFYTMDVLVRFSISRNFQAFFQLNNLFDKHYGGIDASGTINDLRYNPQYGRNFRLGLTFRMD